jgi:transglutaminase-like putative cysteine protease
MSRRRVAGIALTVLCTAAGAGAGEAIYRISGARPVSSHMVNGFTQEAARRLDGQYQVRVSVPRIPIGSPTAYTFDADHRPHHAPEGFVIPASLAERLSRRRTDDEAATEVLRWVDRHLVSDDRDYGNQDALSVLARGRGRCSGIANATAALLQAAGFRARTVSGVLIEDSGPVPHRWVECHFEGRGWVPTDPALGHWVVTHRHVVFPGAVHPVPVIDTLASPEGTGVEGFPVVAGVPRRPSRGPELIVRWVPTSEGGDPVTAQLIGAGGEVRVGRLDPVRHFTALLPGPWLLQVETAGGATIHRQVVALDGAEVVSYVVREDGS